MKKEIYSKVENGDDWDSSFKIFLEDEKVNFEYRCDPGPDEEFTQAERCITLKEYRRALRELEKYGKCEVEKHSLKMMKKNDGQINFEIKNPMMTYALSFPVTINDLKIRR